MNYASQTAKGEPGAKRSNTRQNAPNRPRLLAQNRNASTACCASRREFPQDMEKVCFRGFERVLFVPLGEALGCQVFLTGSEP